MDDLKTRIRQVRGELTYEQFGKELSKSGYVFTKGNLWRYEHDQKLTPSFGFYFAVATQFNIDLNWLIVGQGTKIYRRAAKKRVSEFDSS